MRIIHYFKIIPICFFSGLIIIINHFSIKKEIKIIEEEKLEQKNEKLRIACSYSLDNNYVYPTLVSMTSLVENAGKRTFYDIYVMIDPSFKNENKNILKSVEKKHPEHCKVNFINMGDKFKGLDTNDKIPTHAYFRLDLHNVLPNINRIIWMDGDTAVFEDLTELIKIDMKNYYIMGFLDNLPNAIKRFGISNAIVLCSGVLLLNLDSLRKNNITEKINIFIKENRGEIEQHDQTIINVVCQEYIAKLPAKYGIWNFKTKKNVLSFNKRQRYRFKYSNKEIIRGYCHPSILHYACKPKPFWKKENIIFNNEWWDYAKKSGYYDDIYNKSLANFSRFAIIKKK